MSFCDGNGHCIQQCGCRCYDDSDYEIESEICSCGHRNHTHIIGGSNEYDIYCQQECIYNCQLIECNNYRLCGRKLPQNVLNVHNGMCPDCAIRFGKLRFTNEIIECPICTEERDGILLSCTKHSICINCLVQMVETNSSMSIIPLTCPMCRESIWKWKGK